MKEQRTESRTRHFAEVPVELRTEQREEGEMPWIEGYAAIFDSPTLIGGEKWGFYEQISRGAFDGILDQDIRALFNHKADFILARTKSGTLELFVDAKGFGYRFQAPNTTAGRDLVESIQRGDVDGSSFTFEIEEQKWSFETGQNGLDERTVLKVKRVWDVGPVTYPAYNDTTAAKAQRDKFYAEENPEPRYSKISLAKKRLGLL